MNRRGRLILSVLAIMTLVTTGCEQLLAPPGDAPLRYRDEIFTSVSVSADNQYGTATDQEGTEVDLFVDVYEPVGDTVTARPLLVFVHGGGFTGGSRDGGAPVTMSEAFARRGYVTASISYRLDRVGCSPIGPRCLTAVTHAREDAQAAIAWLRSKASTFGIDPTRVAIAGTSAGAVTAVNVAWSNDAPESSVSAGVSIAGAAVGTSPEPGDGAVMLYHGTADRTVAFDAAVATRDAADAVIEVQAVLTAKEGAGHSVFGLFTDEVIEQTRNFLWWHLDLENAAT